MLSRRALVVGALVAALVAAALPLRWLLADWMAPFPSDTTPEGAYLRIAIAVSDRDAPRFFPYLETAAQHACHTVHQNRARALGLVRQSYPRDEAARLERQWGAVADAADAERAFAALARERGWLDLLARDMSRAVEVVVDGERATVVTGRGTRYSFRRRENGLWGLTAFTAELMAEAERSDRDLGIVERSAADYERGR